MSVIELHKTRHAGGAYWEGPARCWFCGTRWEAVAPKEAAQDGLKCPSCGYHAGFYDYPPRHDGTRLQCACGCGLMIVHERGIYCCSCGAWMSPKDLDLLWGAP